MTTLSRNQIDQAEAAGILPPQQARAMRAELAATELAATELAATELAAAELATVELAAAAPAYAEQIPTAQAVIGDEDDLRFLRSFGDVFVGVGLILLAIGTAAIVGLMGGGPVFLLAAAGAWALAEWFGRTKRAHFPTLITALAFLAFVQTGLESVAPLSGIAAAAITVAAMALFYWRIRLPFCIALIAVSLLYLLIATLYQFAPGMLRAQFGLVMIASGSIIFAAALLYDVQDTHRRTRFADNAFWLHLLAAPLMIHGLVGSAVAGKTELLFDVLPTLLFSERDAVVVLVALGLITLVGLAINRRALIVSSLVYAGAAVAFLVRQAGLDFGTTLSLTLIGLGVAIVLLGVAWHPARNQLIRILPDWRIFPPPYTPGPAT